MHKQTQNNRILIAGCGDIGTHLASRLKNQKLYGLRRSAKTADKTGMQWIQADLTHLASLKNLPEVEYLIYTATPSERTEAAYKSIYYNGLKNLINTVNKTHLKRIFLVSSTSVYGQNNGSWIDEESPTEPKRFSGQILLEAEHWLISQALPATIIRFAGIYGPGRSHLLKKLIAGGVHTQASPPKYTNRIHRDDCSGILAHFIDLDQHQKLEACYIGVDSNPAAEWDVHHWLANQMKTSLPKAIQEAADAKQNKRCSNSRLLKSGYQFKFPNYQSGYKALIQSGI